MNSFRQSCPQCRRELELPIEANGKAAVCPACNQGFVADAARDTSDSGDTVQTESVETAQAVSAAQQENAPRRVHRIVIESVFADTRSVLSRKNRAFFLPFLLPVLLLFLFVGLPTEFWNREASVNRGRAIAGMAGCAPFYFLVITYSMWFALARSAVVCDASRNDVDASESETPGTRHSIEWLPDLRTFGRLYVVTAAFLIAITAILAATVALLQSTGSMRAIEVRVLVVVVSVLGGMAAALALATRLWPTPLCVMSGSTVVHSVRNALAITHGNVFCSFLLVITASWVLGLGLAIFGLGLPWTIPGAALMLTVAFRLMTANPIPLLRESTPPLPADD